jgi:hypothetical protein
LALIVTYVGLYEQLLHVAAIALQAGSSADTSTDATGQPEHTPGDMDHLPALCRPQ